MLRFDRLTKTYGDVAALDDCSFAVKSGQMIGFLGPNGAGKTTAMRAVFGLVRLDAGSVTWHGRQIDPATRLQFGYMPEERGLYPKMTPHEQLRYFGRLHGMGESEADRASKRLLDELALGARAHDPVADLSHGNQQRVQLAVALIHDPVLLVLDEPFSGLDPLAAQNMAEILRRRARAGAAVLFSSHQLDVVEHLCDDVVIVNRGAVVLAGGVMALRSASKRRMLEVVARSDSDWFSRLADVDVVEHDGERVRLEVHEGARLSDLAVAAESTGQVIVFSLEPPSLSELFEEAVS
jgi:ABC-2 type transport system ATP-binding protein